MWFLRRISYDNVNEGKVKNTLIDVYVYFDYSDKLFTFVVKYPYTVEFTIIY